MKSDFSFNTLFEALAESRNLHRCGSPTYLALQRAAASLLSDCGLREPSPRPFTFGPFGEITFPYHSMGACDTTNLFDLDELIIFAFYWANRSRYRRAIDIGANVGLHSLIMARCGVSVTAFEPDPRHFQWLSDNLRINACTQVKPIQAAVSDRNGEVEFVRVLGNTTGSHIAGAKNPYGELERFPVRIQNIAEHLEAVDFMKVDAEGHEAEILTSVPKQAWSHCDCMLEVGSASNAERLFKHFESLGVGLFSQKTGWSRVRSTGDVPTSHHEGSLFVSCRDSMPWTA